MKLWTAILALFVIPLGAGSVRGESLERARARIALLEEHQARLESRLDGVAVRISRLKKQRGQQVTTDFQLEAALRQSQELANRLTRLQNRLSAARDTLGQRYDRLIESSRTPLSQKKRLARWRAELRGTSRRSGQRIVVGQTAGRYDGPEDLEEKADLIKDSEEKVLRQLRRVRERLALVRQRDRLRQHGAAIDDSPFVESAPRRAGRISVARRPDDAAETDLVGGTPAPSAGNAEPVNSAGGAAGPGPAPAGSEASGNPGGVAGGPTGNDSLPRVGGDKMSTPSAEAAAPTPDGPAPPAVGAPSQSGGSGTPTGVDTGAGSSGGSSVLTIHLQGVLDPTLLREIDGKATGVNLKGNLGELRSAARELKRLARRLRNTAKSLRQQAQTLREQDSVDQQH